MPADIKPEKLFLIRKLFVLAPGPDRLFPRRRGRMRLFVVKRNLSGCPIALRDCRRVQRIIDAREELRAIPLRKIERTRLDETFQHLAVGYARIEPRTKILERTKLAALISLANGDRHRCFADVFDRSQAVTNCIVDGSTDAGYK